MISVEDFHRIRTRLGAQAEKDIAWAESTGAPATPEEFALEAAFVICNSGMQNKVARGIFERCQYALLTGAPVSEVFKHKGKVAAMERIWSERQQLHADYLAAEDKVDFLETLPWIGKITKFHLAKGFGIDVAKPDVHLQRLADQEGCTVQAMCERLAAETGLRAATVDVVLWRACANGVINSRTGEVLA